MLVVLSILMASRLNLELMSSIDEGIVDDDQDETGVIRYRRSVTLCSIGKDMVKTDEDVDRTQMRHMKQWYRDFRK